MDATERQNQNQILQYWIEHEKLALTVLTTDGILYFSNDGKVIDNKFEPDRSDGLITTMLSTKMKRSVLMDATARLLSWIQDYEHTLVLLRKIDHLNEQFHFLQEEKKGPILL